MMMAQESAQKKRELIFQRGTRADTLRPGQGLGLSIAVDIIEQYNGDITITDSPLGGKTHRHLC